MFSKSYSTPRGYEYPPPSGKAGIQPPTGARNPQPLSPEDARKVTDAARKLRVDDASGGARKTRPPR